MSVIPPVENQMSACASCHQVWPQSMMVRVDERFVCQLCKERALGTTERYQFKPGMDLEKLRVWGIALTVLAVAVVVGMRMFIRTAGRTQSAAITTSIAESEPWADKDPAAWPAFLLSNQMEVSGSQWRVAPNAFLIQRTDGVTLGATAMIAEPASEDEATPQPFAFKEWKLAATGVTIGTGKVPPTAEDVSAQGILLADVEERADLPVTPLKLRTSGYATNMRMKIVVANSAGGPPKVYPVTVRNNESRDDSRVFTVEKNLVTGRERVVSVSGDGGNSLFELDEKVRVDDLVGAPVIDAFGHVAAIVTGPDHGGAREGMARRVRAFGGDALMEAAGGKSAR